MKFVGAFSAVNRTWDSINQIHLSMLKLLTRNHQKFELQRLRTEYGVAWIMYMRLRRRYISSWGLWESQEGSFDSTLGSIWSFWFFLSLFFLSMFCSLSDLNDLSLYLALMEYYCSYDRAVASRIFERGLDYFGSEEIGYIMFLAISVSWYPLTMKMVSSFFDLVKTFNYWCDLLFWILELYSKEWYPNFLPIALDRSGNVGER